MPGDQRRLVKRAKLTANENPFESSPCAPEAMRVVAAQTLGLYLDPEATELREVLATYRVATLALGFVGNGSDAILAHAFVALLKHSKPMLCPDFT